MGRFIQIALAGADFAIKMAGWKPEQSDLDEVGVYMASGIGGFDIIEREHIKLMQGGPGRFRPFSFLRPSLIWRLGTFRFAMVRAGRIPRRPQRAPLRLTPSAIPSRSSNAAPRK